MNRKKAGLDGDDSIMRQVAAVTPIGSPSGQSGVESSLSGIKPAFFGMGSRLAIKMAVSIGLMNFGLLLGLKPTLLAIEDQLQLYFALVGLAAVNVFAVVLAGYLLGRELAGRVRLISDAVERTQRGDYRLRLKPRSSDELGTLSRRANLLSSSAEVREKRITEAALMDALTGLPNRALLTNRLEHAIKFAERDRKKFSVALIDLDRFKWVNDTLGHDAGDMLLIEVSRRLKAAVRTSDTVARLGGDEFVLLMEGGKGPAKAVASHVLEAIKTPAKLGDQMVDIGMSIGIAVYPDHGRDTLALMRHADSAMYSAKRQQAGRSVYEGDSQSRQPSTNALTMLGEMRTALQQGQFFLEYQPKLDLTTGLIKSLEGLVRWQHPKHGRVPPNDFIPLAEQTGFMRELTFWVVAEGARFVALLAKQQLDTQVSVNVSAQDIQNPEFALSITEIIADMKINPARLCLEITESGVLSETDNAMKNLNAIASLGVQLSVDDFGTGYSSLKQLQNLPVNELKIDRSFVSGMHMKTGNTTIVRSTIDMGRELGLRVVAEGVEKIEELRMLAKMGCDEIQGYHLSKPLSGPDVITWIQMRHSLHENSRDEYFRILIKPS